MNNFVLIIFSYLKTQHMATMQKISSCLWFDNQAEAAANFYVSVFKDSKIGKTAYYSKEGFEIHGGIAGSVLTVEFWLEGQRFVALNGGPIFKFNEAISFIVDCDTQDEIDYYWEKLTDGGDAQAQMCGWLKDKFGVSWQIVPTMLAEMVADKNQEKAGKVMKALLQMKKLDVEKLKQAYNQ
jgi:predicted 3-demethylubiquinone-9 3-methyltransferase (glyoxalase superfamily)